MVVAIIAILISIIVPTTQYARRKAKTAAAQADISAIERAFDEFKNEFGYYPPKPAPTRPFPNSQYGYNLWIWYALVTYDLDMNDSPDIEDYEKYKFLDVAADRFNSSHLFLDPWETPYGVLFPVNPKGWDSGAGESGWPKLIKIWSNGPNKTTVSDNPGNDEDDLRNASYADL
ncbi:MAG: hypothetical protein Kow00107_02450 [Planctomycetota bacterium]